MSQKNHKLFIQNTRKEYKKLGFVECPAFNNEKINFNHYGFDHILYKNGVPRPIEVVKDRLGLLSFVSNILKNIKNVDNEEKRIKDKSHAYFWTIKSFIKGKRIRIIIRRLGDNGLLHFFSVMNE